MLCPLCREMLRNSGIVSLGNPSRNAVTGEMVKIGHSRTLSGGNWVKRIKHLKFAVLFFRLRIVKTDGMGLVTRKEKSMGKSGKFGLAIVLSLVLGLALFTPGVFAQSASPSREAVTMQVVMPAAILYSVQQTGQTSSNATSSSQQSISSLRIVCTGGYVSRRVLVGGVWVWKCVRGG